MNRLIQVKSLKDIPPAYIGSPIELLVEYHNLGREFETYSNARLLVGMCMDNRKHLNIPDNFAFIIRAGGANLRYSEFKVSYSISVGGVRHIALIGHNNCGMVNLISRKNQFVEGMIKATGWNKEQAEDHFMHFAPLFEIGNEIEFTLSEAKRLRQRYPGIVIAPMLYLVEDNMLYFISED